MQNIYNCLASIAYTISYPWLKKKYAEGFEERCGIYSKEKCFENAIWVHAVSVGEVQAAMPFISEAKKDALPQRVILSTTTMTGAKVAKQLSAKYDSHIYYPWDLKRFVTRSLDCIKPRALVYVETEIWPMMLNQLKQRDVPAFLINGRISDKSFRQMSYIPSFWKTVFSCFNHIMVRDELDAYRLEKLGVSSEIVSVTGDCKIDAMLERVDQCSPLQAIKHSKPVFIAGSTHSGEEEQVIKAFHILKKKVPEARLIIVPRHPDRAKDIGNLTSQIGVTAFYSEFENFEFIRDENTWEFLIVDRIGALFCLYGIASSAFIGGSLVPKGGQNIMEPVLFGTPLCHGKYMSDFRHVSDQFKALGISEVVNTPEEIARFWLQSLDENFKHKVANLSHNWLAQHGGAANKCWSIIKKLVFSMI